MNKWKLGGSDSPVSTFALDTGSSETTRKVIVSVFPVSGVEGNLNIVHGAGSDGQVELPLHPRKLNTHASRLVHASRKRAFRSAAVHICDGEYTLSVTNMGNKNAEQLINTKEGN